MSRRSILVLAIVLASVLGVFLLTRFETHETSALEPERVVTPSRPPASVDLQAPLVGATGDDRVTSETRAVTAVAPVEPSKAVVISGEETPDAPAKPISVRVHLVDEIGKAVTHRRPDVTASTDDGVPWSADELEPGLHVFRGLPPASWKIFVTAIGYREAVREIFVPRPDAALDLVIVLSAQPSVRIVLLAPDGDPYPRRAFPRPEAIATRDAPGESIRDELDGKGSFPCGYLASAQDTGLDERHLGLLVLACEPPLWVSLTAGRRVIESRRVEHGTDEVVFHLEPGAFGALLAGVRLRLVDSATRAPLNNAIAEFKFGLRNNMVSVSQDGVVEFASVLPGSASLRILLAEYEHAPIQVDVPAGARLDLGDVPLSAVGSGELRITCDVPEGVTSIETAWGRLTDVREDGRFSSSVQSKYSAREPVVLRLSRGDWRVVCTGEHERRSFRSRPIDVSMNGETLEVRMRLERVAELVLVPASTERRVKVADVTEGRGPASVHDVGARPVTLDLTVGRWEIVVVGPGETERSVTIDLPPEGLRMELE